MTAAFPMAVVLVFIFHCSGVLAAGDWDQQWADCVDLKLPVFQAQRAEFREFVAQGKAWETGMRGELAKVDLLASDTCRKWAENPNGDQPLQEFLRKYADVSNAAIALKERADLLLSAKVQKWWAQENAEAAPYGFQFGQFPCGKAFLRTRQHIRKLVAALEARFVSLKSSCPRAADAVIAEFQGQRREKAAAGEGNKRKAGARAGSSTPPGSRVTGVEKAIHDDSLNQQKLEK